MLIHFIRHTKPDIAEGLCYGQSDIGLADSFEQERVEVLSKLLDNYDAVYTSPLQRCSQLAEFISADKRFSDDRLKEYNFGDWELRPWDDFKSADTKVWMNNFVDQPAPNGENILSMQQRVDSFFDKLLNQNYKTVAVVTHSGVQRLVHANILSTPLNKLFRLQLRFGAVIEVKADQTTGLLTIQHL